MRFRAKLLDISCITHFSSKCGRFWEVQPVSGRARTAKVSYGRELCDGLCLELKMKRIHSCPPVMFLVTN